MFSLLATAIAAARKTGYTASFRAESSTGFALVPNQRRKARTENSWAKAFDAVSCPGLSTTRRKDMGLNSAVSSEQSEKKAPSPEKDTLPNNGAKDTSATAMSSDSDQQERRKSRLEMPWSDFHAWALRDNLPRYTRILPGATPKTYALWRTMLQDVPELSGYPIHFLQEKCVVQQTANNSQTDTTSGKVQEGQNLDVAPDVLPYLDNFYFEPSGGLSGQVISLFGCWHLWFWMDDNFYKL